MATDNSLPQANGAIDLGALVHIRPAEIKTYHRDTYDRISPSKTFDGKNKTVLITGGASGIGLAISESFAKAGTERIVIVQRREEVLQSAKKTIEAKYPGSEVTTYTASVTDYDRISSILKEVGQIDVLVPNVATSHAFVPSAQVSTADFAKTFDTNVVATFHIIKEYLALKTSGPKVVVSVTSASSQIVQPGNIGYGPSKAALNQMIQHLAEENKDSDVTIQTFHPGVILTEMAKELGFDGAAFIPESVELPGDFAVWLASPEAKFLAGKFVWAQWDVDELVSLKERLATNPALLTTTVVV